MAKEKKLLDEPVVYMAVSRKGPPVKEHRIVLRHEQLTLMHGKVLRTSGKIAHFTPTYTTSDPEEVEKLNRMVKRRGMFGLSIVNLSATRAKAGAPVASCCPILTSRPPSLICAAVRSQMVWKARASGRCWREGRSKGVTRFSALCTMTPSTIRFTV